MATSPPELADELIPLTQSHRLGSASAYQRMVYALVAHTLFEYRSDRILLVVSYLLIPFAIGVGVVLGFLLAAGFGIGLTALGLGDVLILLVIILAFLVGWAFRQQAREAPVSLSHSGVKISGLKLGRFDDIFQPSGPATLGVFLGALFGMQHAILVYSPSHVGLPIEGGFYESFLLTLDNACHGVFLDTFELYDLRWGQYLKHTFVSATVFYAFRLSFDAVAFLMIYALYKRYRLGRFFWDFPYDQRDVPGVMTWIATRCREEHHWPRTYHDEMMFLLIAKAFIEGDEDFVQQLTVRLRRLCVDRDVRALFRNSEGKVIFEGYFDSNS